MLDSLAVDAPQARPAAFSFGRFLLRQRERVLLADNAPVELGSRAVELLLALVEADAALLSKDAIMDRVWPGMTVEENNIQVQISALRRALGADRDWIVTVPGRGYRFTGPVAVLDSDKAADASRDVMATAALESSVPPPLSVLVLPLAGWGSDPVSDWFAAGVTASLTTDLARVLPGGTVIAHTTADAYKANPADVREIGRDQGVHYVVEGSVLVVEDRVRTNAQLVAAGTGAPVWADRFDTARLDELQAQDQIVERLARSISVQMIDAEARRAERLAQEHPSEGTARGYVLRANAEANQSIVTRDSIDAACALYERALELEPGNPDALAGIACLRVREVVSGHIEAGRTVREERAEREACLAEAEERLAAALAASPTHPKALQARAPLLRARGQFTDAIAAAEALLLHSPGDPVGLREIGMSLLYLGRAEEAVPWFRRADTVAPCDAVRWTWLQGLGRVLIQLGRDDEAVETLRLAVASNPTYAPAHALLAAALALAGDDAAARAAMAAFRSAEPEMEVEVEALVRRIAVPLEVTHPLYQERNKRVLDGLRRAAGLFET